MKRSYPNKREAAKAATQQYWSDYHARQSRRFRDEATRARSTMGRATLERMATEHQYKSADLSQQAMCIAGVM